jgi:hypothetical protein
MAGFRRGEGRSWPGKGAGVILAHLGFHSDSWKGRRKCRRQCSAAPCIHGRPCLGSCEVTVCGVGLVAGEDVGESRGGKGVLRSGGEGAHGGAARARHACGQCGWRVSGLARGHGRDLSSAGGRRMFKAWDQGGRAGPVPTSGEAETRPVRCSDTLACAGSREHQHMTPFISQ